MRLLNFKFRMRARVRDTRSAIRGRNYYEERALCCVLLLNDPRTRLAYCTSEPVSEVCVLLWFCMFLGGGLLFMHGAQRLLHIRAGVRGVCLCACTTHACVRTPHAHTQCIVAYYLGLLALPAASARARLLMVPAHDTSDAPLSAKLLARARVIPRCCLPVAVCCHAD